MALNLHMTASSAMIWKRVSSGKAFLGLQGHLGEITQLNVSFMADRRGYARVKRPLFQEYSGHPSTRHQGGRTEQNGLGSFALRNGVMSVKMGVEGQLGGYYHLAGNKSFSQNSS